MLQFPSINFEGERLNTYSYLRDESWIFEEERLKNNWSLRDESCIDIAPYNYNSSINSSLIDESWIGIAPCNRSADFFLYMCTMSYTKKLKLANNIVCYSM